MKDKIPGKKPWHATKFADEVIVTGENWPYDFSWDYIGKTFNEGFNKSTGDWVLRMDIDYFIHENDMKKIKQILKKYNDYPAICFPQYQFLPNRFQLKTRLCIALNKKKYPNIELNGGGDMCLATLNSKLITARDVQIQIFQFINMIQCLEIKMLLLKTKSICESMV